MLCIVTVMLIHDITGWYIFMGVSCCVISARPERINKVTPLIN